MIAIDWLCKQPCWALTVRTVLRPMGSISTTSLFDSSMVMPSSSAHSIASTRHARIGSLLVIDLQISALSSRSTPILVVRSSLGEVFCIYNTHTHSEALATYIPKEIWYGYYLGLLFGMWVCLRPHHPESWTTAKGAPTPLWWRRPRAAFMIVDRLIVGRR